MGFLIFFKIKFYFEKKRFYDFEKNELHKFFMFLIFNKKMIFFRKNKFFLE
jgi:hypothetical protein